MELQFTGPFNGPSSLLFFPDFDRTPAAQHIRTNDNARIQVEDGFIPYINLSPVFN